MVYREITRVGIKKVLRRWVRITALDLSAETGRRFLAVALLQERVQLAQGVRTQPASARKSGAPRNTCWQSSTATSNR